MRILYLTQWFEPEPAFMGRDFAAALVARGHAVEVVTAFPNYPGGKVYPGYRIRPYQRDVVDGIVTHRLCVWPSHDRSSLGRIFNYLSFFMSALVFGLLRGRQFDVIYVYHPPITPAAAAALFGAVHGRPFIVNIQDLWPDSVGASGMAGGRVTALLDRVCGFVYRRAARIVPQSDGMMTRLEARGVDRAKMRRIYNWSTYSPATTSAVTLPEGLDDAFVGRINLVYGGNIGQAQSLTDLVVAAKIAAQTRPDIRLHLFGAGIERTEVAAFIAANAPDVVKLHPPVDRHAMDRIFDRADILVAQLKNDPLYEITIPSKVQHYLSCAKPIVAGLHGEAARLLAESGAAVVCEPQDVTALAAAFAQVAAMPPEARLAMGARGAAYYKRHLNFTRAIDETIAVIEETVALPGIRSKDITA